MIRFPPNLLRVSDSLMATLCLPVLMAVGSGDRQLVLLSENQARNL